MFVFLAVVACMWAFGNWFLYHFESQEVVWETHGFWVRYHRVYQWLLNDPENAIDQTLKSIATQDYNYLSIWPLFLFRVFTDTRMGFFLSILNIYALPSATLFVMFSAFFREPFARSGGSVLPFAVPAATLLLMVPFWVPIMTGYLDVGLMIFSCACFILWLRRPIHQISYPTILGIGFLLAFGVLFRRPYLIWVLSFLCMLGADALVSYADALKTRLVSLLKIILTGAVFGGCMLLIAWPLVQHMLTYDYSDSYSAYKMQGTAALMLLDFYKYFGSLGTFLFVAGVVTALGRPSSAKVSALLLLQLVLTFVIFHSIQDFGPYHYYLLLPTVALFASEFVLFLIERYRTMRIPLVFAGCLAAIVFFGGAFFPSTNGFIAPARSLLAIRRNYPVVRQDLPEIERLIGFLSGLVEGTKDTVYVLADSNTLQDRTLLFASYALGRPVPLEKNVVGTALVDKRDGFSKYLFDATYVVVGSPIWHTLKSVDQRVLMLPAQKILKGEGIGKSYELLPERFMFDRKTRVYVYKRVRPFRKADLHALSEELRKAYPDRPDIYTLPVREELIAP